MLIFRSEDHLDRWLAGRTRGAVMSIAKLTELSAAWWGNRLAPDWQPRPFEQGQAILDRLGLTGPFWRLG